MPAPKIGTPGWDPEGETLDRAIAVALRASPDLRIRNVQFPFEGDPGLVIEGQASAVLVRDRANAVFIDPETRDVLLASRGERLNWHQRISEAADPLHFGTWGGLPTKIVWFLFGLLLTSLSVTGVAVYALRLKKAEGPAKRRFGSLGRWWNGMGPLAYVGVAILLLAPTSPRPQAGRRPGRLWRRRRRATREASPAPAGPSVRHAAPTSTASWSQRPRSRTACCMAAIRRLPQSPAAVTRASRLCCGRAAPDG